MPLSTPAETICKPCVSTARERALAPVVLSLGALAFAQFVIWAELNALALVALAVLLASDGLTGATKAEVEPTAAPSSTAWSIFACCPLRSRLLWPLAMLSGSVLQVVEYAGTSMRRGLARTKVYGRSD